MYIPTSHHEDEEVEATQDKTEQNLTGGMKKKSHHNHNWGLELSHVSRKKRKGTGTARLVREEKEEPWKVLVEFYTRNNLMITNRRFKKLCSNLYTGEDSRRHQNVKN